MSRLQRFHDHLIEFLEPLVTSPQDRTNGKDLEAALKRFVVIGITTGWAGKAVLTEVLHDYSIMLYVASTAVGIVFGLIAAYVVKEARRRQEGQQQALAQQAAATATVQQAPGQTVTMTGQGAQATQGQAP